MLAYRVVESTDVWTTPLEGKVVGSRFRERVASLLALVVSGMPLWHGAATIREGSLTFLCEKSRGG